MKHFREYWSVYVIGIVVIPIFAYIGIKVEDFRANHVLSKIKPECLKNE